MGAAGETATPPVTSTKSPKTTSSAAATPAVTTAATTTTTTTTGGATVATAPVQEAQAGAPGYNEWLAAFQAYYQAGAQPPAGGFPHPYMWAGQPMMPPPYGGPHPSYGAMYPPGGMYGHPLYGQYGAAIPEAMAGGEQADGKTEGKSDGGKQTPLKRSKGSKGSLQLLKVSESGGKGNGVSQSSNGEENENEGETGSDGSTDGSREENAQNLLGGKRSFEQMTIEAVGAAAPYMPPPPTGAVVGPPPPVGPPGSGGSLDMSLDYWSAGSVPQPKGGKRASGSPSTSAPPAELWLTDEREVKRQRRKQSNRESARRSRLRKQAECEELGTRVDTLTVENMALRTELSRVTEECKRLQAENSSLVHKIRSTPPSEFTAALPSSDSAAPPPAPSEHEVPIFNKEIDDSQGNANGNVKAKDEKPAVNGDAGVKAQDHQNASA